MSKTTKSPLALAQATIQVADQVLPRYSHRFSPKKFTLPQLLAILVLKKFFKTDYRGIMILLQDSPKLTRALGLKSLPHYTTVQKAAGRILTFSGALELLYATAENALKRKTQIKRAAIDSTGLETGHISPYFLERRHHGKIPHRNTRLTRWPKLAIIADTRTHVILTALSTYGPSSDSGHFQRALDQLPEGVLIDTLLADAGYDSEKNHVLANECYGIKTVIPPKIGCPGKSLPKGCYRRQMAVQFNQDAYRHRQQVETVISMIKRNLGDSLRSRTEESRNSEMQLMTITHNLMILLFVLNELFYSMMCIRITGVSMTTKHYSKEFAYRRPGWSSSRGICMPM